MFVNLNVRWIGSGPGLCNEVDAVIAWPFAGLPARGDVVAFDGLDFTVTEVKFQFAPSPVAHVYTDYTGGPPVTHDDIAQWLEGLHPAELTSVRDAPYPFQDP